MTAVAGDPRANRRFYVDVLGLRLVKRTVNFDDPSTYHLYYGDRTGRPGTAMTFFPFEGAPAGRPGRGQVVNTSFVVPAGSLTYWRSRLEAHDVTVRGPEERAGVGPHLSLRDDDGLGLELVAGAGPGEPWSGADVPASHAIRGFHGITIASNRPVATGDVLALLGFERVASTGGRTRFRVNDDAEGQAESAGTVDLVEATDPGRGGVGTVHHVAFRVPDEAAQDAWRDRLLEAGLGVSPPRDRRYFRSIYFREPGGVLFELATEGPGFTRDEQADSLGTALALPPWLEDRRAALEASLPPIAPRGEGEVS